ncbi:MAG: zinc metallopeptidase [Verrucomicrobiae bacterium]|nr:zinc metallopeptidase [Verrucomicrobiae bacterium]
MRWKDARRSQNVEDRRGQSPRRGGGKVVGGGLGTIVIALVAIFLLKQDPEQVLSSLGQQMQQQGGYEEGSYSPQTAEEQEMDDFTRTVLAYTEDVWDQLYPTLSQQYQRPGAYEHPTLVIFSDAVASACGNTSAAVGPFYCPADQKVYIDLAFYDELKRKFSAPGDFAQAYVIAHEVGHHVQNLLGISSQVHQARQRARSEEEANRLSVRQELQADFFAGVWAHHGQRQFNFLERGDVEEGLGAARGVGDDMIQKRSMGYVVPDAFTHGTAEQRIRWFKRGLETGDPTAYNPFDGPYEEL